MPSFWGKYDRTSQVPLQVNCGHSAEVEEMHSVLIVKRKSKPSVISYLALYQKWQVLTILNKYFLSNVPHITVTQWLELTVPSKKVQPIILDAWLDKIKCYHHHTHTFIHPLPEGALPYWQIYRFRILQRWSFQLKALDACSSTQFPKLNREKDIFKGNLVWSGNTTSREHCFYSNSQSKKLKQTSA